jgi:hypothetical protein
VIDKMEIFYDAIDSNNMYQLIKMDNSMVVIDIDNHRKLELRKYDELLKDKQLELLGILIEIQEELRRSIREMQIEIYKDIMKESKKKDNKFMEILMALSLI